MLKVQQVPYLLKGGQDLGSVLARARMKIPELSLLQSAEAGSQLGQGSSITKGAVVAAYGLFTVMLGLIQLPKLLPESWLGWLP